MLKTGIYPGTFDPITLGHLDVIKRAIKICDKLVIAIAEDSPKTPLFSVEERIKMIKESIIESSIEGRENIDVVAFEGLLIEYAKKNKSNIIIRGLRAVSDFEYEFQLASMNSRLNSDIQTIFIPASENRHFIASNLVKEVARLGGDISSFVSKSVAREVIKKLS